MSAPRLAEKVDHLLRALVGGRPVDIEDIEKLQRLGYLTFGRRLTQIGWARLIEAKRRVAS